MGGRNGLFQTIKAVIYGETPILVLGWIPVINLFAAIWMIIVGIIGVRQLHGLSTGTAVIAMILALLIPSIIFVALLAYLMPMIQSLLSDRDLEDIKSPYYSFSYTCFPELEFKGACKLLSSKLRDERVFYLVRLLFPDQKFN
jgi:amino acid transporter